MQLPAADSLTKLDDRELLRDLYGLAAFGRRVVVRWLEFLNEVEARRLHLLEGCPSMFELCRRLGFSEGETLRRLAAARLMKRHPAVREELTTGRVHLTGLYMIHKYVTSENVESLLARIRGKTKDEVEDLLIELDPKRAKARAEVPSQMRRIPSSLVAVLLFGAGDAIALGAKVGAFQWFCAGLVLGSARAAAAARLRSSQRVDDVPVRSVD